MAEPTYFAALQIGGIRYQRKPYLCMVTTNYAQAVLYASTITNAVVVPFTNLDSIAQLAALLVNGTAPVGGLVAGQIVYYDSGTSTLKPAKADAKATARKIQGVSMDIFGAGTPATLSREGFTRILCAADCVPIKGEPLYLSPLTAGTCTSVLNGSTYPRIVAYAEESAIDANNTVGARLSIDEKRDDSAQWFLVNDTITVAASALSYPTIRDFWTELVVEFSNIGAAAQSAIDYPADTSQAFQASGAAVVNVSYYPNDAGTITGISSIVSGSSYYLMTDRKVAPTVWVAKHECWAMNKVTAGVRRYGNSRKTNPADTVSFSGGANLVFPINSHIHVYGRVDT